MTWTLPFWTFEINPEALGDQEPPRGREARWTTHACDWPSHSTLQFFVYMCVRTRLKEDFRWIISTKDSCRSDTF